MKGRGPVLARCASQRPSPDTAGRRAEGEGHGLQRGGSSDNRTTRLRRLRSSGGGAEPALGRRRPGSSEARAAGGDAAQAWHRRWRWWLPALLAAGALSARGFTPLSADNLKFVNVDHAPVGTCSTLAYGFTGPTPTYYLQHGDCCGLGMSSPAAPYNGGGGGVLIALSANGALQSMPFLYSPASVSASASFFPSNSLHRALTPCTDQWTIDNSPLSFTHYTPAWLMAELNTATLADKKRFFLPATWLVLTVNNTNSTPADLYFGLPTAATQTSFAGGAYQGFVVGEAALAVQTGSCSLLSGPSLTSALNGMSQGFAFHLTVPPGQTGTVTVVVAFYRSAVVDTRTSGSYYYTTLFKSVDAVIDAAFAGLADAQIRCQQLATAVNDAGLNPFRQFLAGHAMHSYMANTACLVDPAGGVGWRVTEGGYGYINTFDLTVDHAFYESMMCPWALRNVLDTFSGAINGPGYSFTTALYDASSNLVSSEGYSFLHDMGGWPTSGTVAAYCGECMAQEELHTWILSAGLYFSHTGDQTWLMDNLAVLQTCLNSMLLRDSTNATARDGITRNLSLGETSTTFDSLDTSLHDPRYSGRLAVRNWACYLALQTMFEQAADPSDAATCGDLAGVAAQTIAETWTNYSGTLGYIPALLDGSDPAAVILLVEGLAYPAQMGLTNAVDRVGGPYAPMLVALSNHLAAVLVPGLCLDAQSGAWDMTSVAWSGNDRLSWQSKIYIAQYVAEQFLGFTGNNVDGTVDQVHATVQVEDASLYGWCDQLNATAPNGSTIVGSIHYPRGITSALWWLTPADNPGYPVPTSPPAAPGGLTALAGNGQVVLLWNGVALAAGYDVGRATVSGGPYTPVTNGLTGASFLDTGLINGLTYYYVVTATNQAGSGLPSAEVSATPHRVVPSNGTNVTASVTGGTMTLSWPASYVNWILQTNGGNLANPLGWGDVPGSGTNDQFVLPVGDAAIPIEFFRLRHP